MYRITNNLKELQCIVGKKPLCNKKPERAPWIFGFCFPLCWRCTSLIIGYCLGIVIQFIFLRSRGSMILGILACVPCFVDHYLQEKQQLESTNIRRILTGLLAGIGVSFFHWK